MRMLRSWQKLWTMSLLTQMQITLTTLTLQNWHLPWMASQLAEHSIVCPFELDVNPCNPHGWTCASLGSWVNGLEHSALLFCWYSYAVSIVDQPCFHGCAILAGCTDGNV